MCKKFNQIPIKRFDRGHGGYLTGIYYATKIKIIDIWVIGILINER